MDWSQCKATQAAQKLPDNWEDICEKSSLHKVYILKDRDITHQSLYINSDQTNINYAPGDKLTWAERGAKQVSLVGGDKKRAFTIMVSVASDGTLLPFQAIYKGKTSRSLPSKHAPCWGDATNAGIRFEFSGMDTYWSNQQLMQKFIDDILAPYFKQAKTKLGLPPNQHTLWQIDVWSVHRSQEFRDWMQDHHPTIVLDFVPGDCTGIYQPCNVGIQRPFKLSIK